MTPADTVRVRVLDRDVARLGFGCCPMGQHGWGPTSDGDLVEAVHAALDRGITFFDTSDTYGLGHSEYLLGKAIAGRRNDAVIATKFGVRHAGGKTTYDCSPDWIRSAVNASLSRLNADVIDVYQMHYWDGRTPLDEIFGALQELRTAGKVRAFGVTNFDLRAAGTRLPEHLATFSHAYSLTNRSAEQAIAGACAERGPTFLSWGSLGHGMLSGKYSADTSFGPDDRRSRPVYSAFHGAGLDRSLQIVDAMRAMLADLPGRTFAQVAIRWILDRFPGAVALVGTKSPAQLADNAGSLGWRLSQAQFDALDRASAG